MTVAIAVRWKNDEPDRNPVEPVDASHFAGVVTYDKQNILQDGTTVVSLSRFAELMYACSGQVVQRLTKVSPKGVAEWRRDLDYFDKKATSYRLKKLGVTREEVRGLRQWLARCEELQLGIKLDHS